MKTTQLHLSIIAALLLIITALISIFIINKSPLVGDSEVWPVHRVTKQQQAVADFEAAKYLKLGFRSRQIGQYLYTGDYLEWGITARYVPSERMMFDSTGLP